MSAYLIANVEVLDSAGYEVYRQGVPDAIKPYGGRYLARGGKTAPLEGDIDLHRCVIIEFPSMDKLQQFWNSPEYMPLRAAREKAARSRIYALEGVEQHQLA